MSIGVPWEVFWEESFDMVDVYLEKFKVDARHRNNDSWLDGFYVYKAVETALSNGFRKKGAKGIPYMEKPLDLSEQEELTEEQKIEGMYNKFKSLVTLFNNNRK